jgi:hypothetical protein
LYLHDDPFSRNWSGNLSLPVRADATVTTVATRTAVNGGSQSRVEKRPHDVQSLFDIEMRDGETVVVGEYGEQ